MSRRCGVKDHRSHWHEEARQMKRDGVPLADIAEKFGRTIPAVGLATKGIPAKHGARRNRGEVGGFPMGSKARVAISFSDDQVQRINEIALSEGVSFSLAVSMLVDVALQSGHSEALSDRIAA
jgi:hypothetical protein